MINGILNTSWGHLLNLGHLIFGVIWPKLFRVAVDAAGANPHARRPHLPPGMVALAPLPIPLWQACMVVVVVCAVCLLLLNRRLRAREVVRG